MDEYHRRQRAHAIFPLIRSLESASVESGFDLPLKSSNGLLYVRFDRMWLRICEEYYLKYTPSCESIGTMAVRLLRNQGIRPNLAIDVGANAGEVTLTLSREFPDCKILAVEAATKTFNTLALNLLEQDFPTLNVTPFRLAIAKETGFVDFTLDYAQCNRIASPADKNVHGKSVEKVRSFRLQDFLDFVVGPEKVVDFLKIDIEGSEPDLTDDILKSASLFRSLLIECSKYAPLDDYMLLFSGLFQVGFSCYAEWGRSQMHSAQDLENYLRDLIYYEGSQSFATDVFFCRTTHDL